MDKKTFMENIQSFVLKTGYSPLDMKVQVKNDTLKVSFCIFKKDAPISLDDCSKVTLVVRDFLNMLLGKEADFIVDVSSPGADRKLKTWQEFSLFTGKKVRLTRKNEPPVEGILRSVIEPDKVVFLWDDKEVTVPYDDIVCCQLVL
jgi:ribosome maturation factor RimP